MQLKNIECGLDYFFALTYQYEVNVIEQCNGYRIMTPSVLRLVPLASL